MDFKGKYAVITGGSSGIGRETAIAFAKRGANVILVARNEKKLNEVKDLCLQKGAAGAFAFVCDVGDYPQVKLACGKIAKRCGRVDVLVNNAGFGAYRPFENQEVYELEQMMKTNFFGTVYFTKELLRLMQSGSHIVNVSSMAGKLAFPNYSGYGASKFALSGFTGSIYYELKERGIGVHLVCPTGTKTRFFDNESFRHMPKSATYGKMMEASSVARLIIDAIEKNRREVVPTLRGRMGIILNALFPQFFGFIVSRNYQRRKKEGRNGQENKIRAV